MVTADGIEECRKACGGHGYLSCSGLPELFTSYLQSPTVEGDNHMLPQQVIRVLLKLVQAVQQQPQQQNTNLDKIWEIFLVDGYMRLEHASWIELNVLQYLSIVRPNAVALVDARDFSDFRLKSVLGRYDGNVYPYIMEAAQKDPLNAVEPGPPYEVALKRLVKGGVGVYSGTASRL
ncbi:acyl-CoA oxidase [Nitzschia inconspicua]|uniref:Acyl-CoA oxidase n=1 Tax=Nitzschia inconspicua TaxID=303405 RepID=A0A9K3PAI9_9STRA|nr:acyl-CoA oxidase [Nitzschia inconspicua]